METIRIESFSNAYMIGVFAKKTIFFFILCIIVFNLRAQSGGCVASGNGDSFCDTSSSSGFISLSSISCNDSISFWESSTDSIVWTNIGPFGSYYHLKQTTWYRAIIKNGAQPLDTSTVSKINIYSVSVGGTVSGGGIFCGGTGVGTLKLKGYVGSVLYWQHSTDNGNNWIVDTNTLDSLNYTNITQNTAYEAVVQSNIACPVDTSSRELFAFFASSAGSLTGGGTYCANSGAGTITLNSHLGAILNWQYSADNGASWTNVSNTTTQLNYSNITQNTLYEVVVKLGSCPPDTSSPASFVFDPTVAGTVTSDDTVCFGTNSGTLNLTGNTGKVTGWLSSTNNGVTWVSIADTTISLSYTNLTQTTLYQAVVKNDSCTSDTSTSVTITVLPLPTVNAGNDTSIYPTEFVKLNGAGVGDPLWSPSTALDSVNILKPISSPAQTILYTLTITDSNTCVNTDSVLITVRSRDFEEVISNLFTPNGDGINDTWYIKNIQNFSDSEVFIYNIYGNIVYNKKGYSNDWAGTYNGVALPDGTYYYVLKFDSSDKVYKGALDILKNK